MNSYKYTDKTSYCLGTSLTIEALKHSPKYVYEVILSDKIQKNEQYQKLISLLDTNNIPYSFNDKLIEKISVKENCYCIGFFNKFYRNIQSDEHIVLYQFSEYGELGTIIRSAVSFDYKDIILIDSDIDYFDPRCIRASMGAIFHCNIEKYNSLDEYLNKYKYNIYPFSSKEDKELNNLKLNKPYSIIIGQDYHSLDNKFNESYYIKHNNDEEISLSIRSSIILEKAFYLKRNL